jgi:hypothetical protein
MGGMTARIHTALQYRLAVHVWVLALAIALALATIAAVALIDASSGASPEAIGSASGTSVPQQSTSCIDSSVVGHC